MARKCFYSFHYQPDNARAAQVRNIGVIEGNASASDNDWETVKRGGESAIKRWIDNQLEGRTATIVLVGAETANRKWINYEIVKSWDKGMGVVGICIHGLKNFDGATSSIGRNPFDYTKYDNTGRKLSSIVKCYNPAGSTSKERYGRIADNLSAVVEEAIQIRRDN